MKDQGNILMFKNQKQKHPTFFLIELWKEHFYKHQLSKGELFS